MKSLQAEVAPFGIATTIVNSGIDWTLVKSGTGIEALRII